MSEPGLPAIPRLSVVIPTFNDPHCLELTIRALTRQTLPAELFEVVVVNDGGDADYRGVERYRDELRLRLVDLPGRRGRSAARNEGLRQARGRSVLLLDADSYAESDVLERHYAFHDATGWSRILFGKRYEIGWQHLEFLMNGEAVPKELLDAGIFGDLRFPDVTDEAAADRWLQTPWIFAYTNHLSAPRDLLTGVGGFDEEFGLRWGWEDLDIFYRVYQRLGYDHAAFAYDGDAVCYHLPHHRDVRDLIQQFRHNVSLMKQRYRNFDWEFADRWAPKRTADRIRYLRRVIAACAEAGTCRVPAVHGWVTEQLAAGADRILWIGFGTGELRLGPDDLTFDYGAPPSEANLHLIGVDMPLADGSFDAVVNVDFWRYLEWVDVCVLIREALRVAGSLLLVTTPAGLADPPAATMDRLRYLTRAMAGHFDATVAEDGGGAVAVRLSREGAR